MMIYLLPAEKGWLRSTVVCLFVFTMVTGSFTQQHVLILIDQSEQGGVTPMVTILKDEWLHIFFIGKGRVSCQWLHLLFGRDEHICACLSCMLQYIVNQDLNSSSRSQTRHYDYNFLPSFPQQVHFLEKIPLVDKNYILGMGRQLNNISTVVLNFTKWLTITQLSISFDL